MTSRRSVTDVCDPESYIRCPWSPNGTWATALNPLTPLLEGFRLAFLGTGIVDLTQLVGSLLGMFVLLVIGLMLFTHIERNFMDTV